MISQTEEWVWQSPLKPIYGKTQQTITTTITIFKNFKIVRFVELNIGLEHDLGNIELKPVQNLRALSSKKRDIVFTVHITSYKLGRILLFPFESSAQLLAHSSLPIPNHGHHWYGVQMPSFQLPAAGYIPVLWPLPVLLGGSVHVANSNHRCTVPTKALTISHSHGLAYFYVL